MSMFRGLRESTQALAERRARGRKQTNPLDVLRAMKMQQELEDAQVARQMIFGGGSQSGGRFVAPTVRFGGQEFVNPNYKPSPRPLTEKEQFDLDQIKQKQNLETEHVMGSAKDMLGTVREIKGGMQYFGPMGNLPTILAPSTLAGRYRERKNWEVNVNKLLSGKILDIMNAMKRASRTGATGFGQLSNKELGVLREASTALKKDLAPEDAMRYLNDIERMQRKILNPSGMGGAKTSSQGQVMVDANGNRAMVYPDGTYKEL